MQADFKTARKSGPCSPSSYPVQLTPKEDGYLVTFPDFPNIFSAGSTRAQALEQATDTLHATLEFAIRERQTIPTPSQPLYGQDVLCLSTLVTAKVLLALTMQEQGVRKADLVRAMGVNPPQVDRLLDLQHSSKIEMVGTALC